MTKLTITDVGAEGSNRVRAELTPALADLIEGVALREGTHALGVSAIAAKILIEHFFALDPNAAQEWLASISWENEPGFAEEGRAQNFRAFVRLAAAQAQRDAAASPARVPFAIALRLVT